MPKRSPMPNHSQRASERIVTSRSGAAAALAAPICDRRFAETEAAGRLQVLQKRGYPTIRRQNLQLGGKAGTLGPSA